MSFFNTVPGLVPLKIYSGSTLLTTNVNLINFTGSGVTTTVNAFNGLTVNIGGGGTTVDTGSLLKTASFSNPNLTFTKGDGSTFAVNLVTLVPTSASYALSSSYAATASIATSASYAPVTPPFPYTGSAQITGSLGVTGSVSLRSGSNLTVNNGLILASYNTSNVSVGNTPGWTSALRNTAFGISTQGSVTTQTDNTSVGYLSLLGGTQNTAVGAYSSQLNTGIGNTAMGYYALGNQTSDTSYNVAVGYQAMYNSSGSGNLYGIGIGYQALNNNIASNNIGIGYRAGVSLTTGYYNIAIGGGANGALYSAIAGHSNIAIGPDAGSAIVNSSYNIMIGRDTANRGSSAAIGDYNIGIGYGAMNLASSSNSIYNIGIGWLANERAYGSSNIAMGALAGRYIGTGANNTFIGTSAGQNISNKSGNVGVGSSALGTTTGGNNNVAVGNSALVNVTGDNNIVLGNNSAPYVITGTYNLIIGNNSLLVGSGTGIKGSGSYNIFMGGNGTFIFDYGSYNIGIGYESMGGVNGSNAITEPGNINTAVGVYTLKRLSGSATTRNTAFGGYAGNVMTVGGYNTFLGAYAGNDFITGSYNLFVGDNAGDGLISGSNNTIIGSINGLSANLINTLIIGVSSSKKIQIDANNMFVGGLPGFTTGLRNTAIGLSSQGSVTTQTDNTSLGYLSLLGGTQNTAVGTYASQLNTGTGNTSLGYYALGNQTSNTSYNVAIGWQAMYNASGSGDLYNVGIGYQALYAVQNTHNIGVGYRAGFRVTTGTNNILLGYRAGEYVITTSANIAIGFQAGLRISGSDTSNIFIGYTAGGSDSGGITHAGSANVGIGTEALLSISSSAGGYPGNTALGFQAARNLSTGAGNIAIGYRGGYGIGRGNSNIYLGSDTCLQSTTLALSNNIGIGGSSFNQNISGSFNVGIGVSALQSIGITSSAAGANNGSHNVALGYNAGSIAKTGLYNTFIGSGAGRNNAGNPTGEGNFNTFVGAETAVLQSTDGGNFGNYNSAFGYASMGNGTGGGLIRNPGQGNTGLGSHTLMSISSSNATRNTAAGFHAGKVIRDGGYNTVLGSYSGQNFITGSYNIMIGDSAGSGVISGSNNTIIGSISGLTASLDNTIIIAAGTTERIRIDASGSMGLGTSSPSSSAKLQIDSTIQGFLPPRMTNAQRTAITSPSIGLMVYCTDVTEGLYVNKSTGWTFIV